MNTLTRTSLAAVTAVALSCGLAACGPSVPEVVWLGGPPSGPFEDDPWVQALREADLQAAIATVTHDYTTKELRRSVTEEAIKSIAGAAVGRADVRRWRTDAGPTPMRILSIDESSDGQSAVVVVCRGSHWVVSPDRPEPPEEVEGWVGLAQMYLGEDGYRRLDGIGSSDEADECDLTGAARGVFDPLPDPEATYSSSDVKRP